MLCFHFKYKCSSRRITRLSLDFRRRVRPGINLIRGAKQQISYETYYIGILEHIIYRVLQYSRKDSVVPQNTLKSNPKIFIYHFTFKRVIFRICYLEKFFSPDLYILPTFADTLYKCFEVFHTYKHIGYQRGIR